MEVARLKAEGSSNETNTEDEDDTDEMYCMHQTPSTSKAQTLKRRRMKVIGDSNLIASWDCDKNCPKNWKILIL